MNPFDNTSHSSKKKKKAKLYLLLLSWHCGHMGPPWVPKPENLNHDTWMWKKGTNDLGALHSSELDISSSWNLDDPNLEVYPERLPEMHWHVCAFIRLSCDAGTVLLVSAVNTISIIKLSSFGKCNGSLTLSTVLFKTCSLLCPLIYATCQSLKVSE